MLPARCDMWIVMPLRLPAVVSHHATEEQPTHIYQDLRRANSHLSHNADPFFATLQTYPIHRHRFFNFMTL